MHDSLVDMFIQKRNEALHIISYYIGNKKE